MIECKNNINGVKHLVTEVDMSEYFKVFNIMPFINCNKEAEINNIEFLSLSKGLDYVQ